jgi:DNA-binding NarL/FixJ family response regulator
MAPTRKPRLLLADDHELLLDGLRKLLETDFEVAGMVKDGRAAVAAFQSLNPDLVLLDIGLPLLNGIETARQIRGFSSAARILFVTMQTDRIYVEEAFRAGGSGYVLKQAAANELVDAIHAVLRGHSYISPQVMASAGLKFSGIGNHSESPRANLTVRQREVLQLVAEGKTMKEIARILVISVRTVEFHKNGIMRETGLRSTAELTRYAVNRGIV